MSNTSDIVNDAAATTGTRRTTLAADASPQSAAEYVRAALKRMRGGDLGPLPIIFGLVLIVIIFQSLNDKFLTPHNFVNLIVQMAGVTAIAYGVVFVLLLGEIDLSVGYVSAVVGVSLVVMLRPGSVDSPTMFVWYTALPIALLIGAAIGILHGLIITTFQVPSFVVTLAGLLAWNGVVLAVIGEGGTLILQDQTILGVANSYLPPEWGWIAAVAVVAWFGIGTYLRTRARRKKGLHTTPISVTVVQVVAFAFVILFAVYVVNQDIVCHTVSDQNVCVQRGVPVVGVILLLLLVSLTFLTERTRFGRYIYAIGGNKEAARRAGIKVERTRVLVFMLSSLLAGVGGVILASRLRSVDTNAGGGQLLLNSIASAVIGGASLFGGRGKISNALLGALVIASVENGMGLLNISDAAQFIVTGLVLLAAVIVDALSRRRLAQSGVA